MNNLAWTVLTNLVGNSMAFADAKAFVLAYYVLPGDQAAAATLIDNAETDIETLAGDAPIDRDASWYQINGPYQDELPSNAGQPNPSYTGADVDKVLTVGATGLVFATGGGGGGLAGIGAFDTTPNADGLSVTTGDVSLSLGDATHPGGVSPTEPAYVDGLTSTLGGYFTGTPAAGSASGVNLGEDPAFHAPAIWLGETTLDIAHAWIYRTGGNGLTMNCPGAIAFQNNGVTQATLGTAGLDMSGMLPGAYLKLKSPDGTIYTVSIADGGTWVIT